VSETTSKSPTNDAAPASPEPGGTEPTALGSEPRSDTTKILLGTLLLLLVIGIALLIAFVGFVRHWLAVHTGTLNGGPDIYYNFWSGFGSDLGEATLISAVAVGVYTGVRKVNCHTKGCWRIGHHPLDGTPYILCRHHHPHVPSAGATHAHILDHYRRVQEGKAPPA